MTGVLREFVCKATEVIDENLSETTVLAKLHAPFANLISRDDWLPEAFTRSDPTYYQQYLLHCDPLQRFSIVSVVWGPGQGTPIHNHTVWGMVGVVRGAELSTHYASPEPGKPMVELGEDRLDPGKIEIVSPELGDIHRVRNVYDDQTSISIHIYGANIGKVQRQVFDPATGEAESFTSGFSSEYLPNIWA